MFKVKYSKKAKIQARRIFEYYDKINNEISTAFQLHYQIAVDQLALLPKAYPIYYGSIRKKLMDKFSYGVFYTIEKDEVLIVSVLHMAQNNLTAKLH